MRGSLGLAVLGLAAVLAAADKGNIPVDLDLAVMISDVQAYLLLPQVAGIVIACLAMLPLTGLSRHHFWNEFFGTILLVFTQFTPGKWIGTAPLSIGDVVVSPQHQMFFWHGVGVVFQDWAAGGPCVNTSVTLCFYLLGTFSYPMLISRVAGQILGALIAFPMARVVGQHFGFEPLGGPEYDPAVTPMSDAAADEAAATFFLCLGVIILNWELPIKSVYMVKQPLTAVLVRLCLNTFSRSGPAMNPMLALTYQMWAASEKGGDHTIPTGIAHYVPYWVASFSGAVLCAFAYALYSPATHRFAGFRLRGSDAAVPVPVLEQKKKQ